MEILKKILKWCTAIATLLILTLVLYIVGAHVIEGFPNNVSLASTEIQLSVAMGALFLGALIGLKWRLTGGLLSIISFSAFAIVEGQLLLGYVFYIFLLIGISNVTLYVLNKRK